MATAAAKKKAPAKGGMAARLAKLGAKKPASKSKSTKPDVTLTCTDEIAKFGDALKAKKVAEAQMKDLKAIIGEEAEEQLISESRRTHTVVSSLRLNNRLSYTGPGNRYCQIVATDDAGEMSEHATALQELFGDKFDDYFTEGSEVKIEASQLTDDLLQALVDACTKVGVEFGDVFASKSTLKPTETFTHDRILDAGIAAKFDEAVSEGLLKPFSPTLKE